MTWLSDLRRGDTAMIYSVNEPPRKRKVVSARDSFIKIGGMRFYLDTGTTPGDRFSLGPPHKPERADAEIQKGERVYLATRVRNASTHELTTDQLRRLVEILDEKEAR